LINETPAPHTNFRPFCGIFLLRSRKGWNERAITIRRSSYEIRPGFFISLLRDGSRTRERFPQQFPFWLAKAVSANFLTVAFGLNFLCPKKHFPTILVQLAHACYHTTEHASLPFFFSFLERRRSSLSHMFPNLLFGHRIRDFFIILFTLSKAHRGYIAN